MTTVLYMAQTANGMIADSQDDTSFVSESGWDFYKQLVENSQAVIMGRKTYEVMKTEGSLDYLSERMVVVISTSLEDTDGSDGVFITSDSPEDIIANLNEQGVSEIFVSGGGITNTSFLKQGLIDQLILDVEPKLIGEGICLCAPDELDVDLKLEQVKEFGEGGVRLFYQVVK